ncbi:uncharacterized protein IWZ02DRAFT_437423 [Phyllosticta citriasiana]|uniref:Uncharacterized protein n=1 Tax=Phyllosticta citriasiana TaxID=595635 RepID=A0ABR1KEZ6_9PEZI
MYFEGLVAKGTIWEIQPPGPDFWLLDCYREGSLKPTLFGKGLKRLKFERVLLNMNQIQEAFDCVPTLEEVTFQECTIDGPRLDGIPVVTENGELRKELRRLNVAGCNFQRPNRSQMKKFFGALRSYGRLQGLHFEAGRGFSFDWNRSGLEDDRAQLLTDIKRNQILSALNAMNPYIRAQAQVFPNPDMEVNRWTEIFPY